MKLEKMRAEEMIKKAKQVAKKHNFEINKEIYRGVYNSKNNLRNIIYSGSYENKSAVLKFYDDPKLTDEPISLEAFLRRNKSKILRAPVLYAKEIISPSSGWMISEKIPKAFSQFEVPLDESKRKEFLKVFLEYRNNFPKTPTRKLYFVEKLSPVNFHIFRINRWLELAQKREAENLLKGKKSLLDDDLLLLLEKAIEEIRKEFKGRRMIWCHGHFKPQEVFGNKGQKKYYLTDFAHTAMFPEGYELAFMPWADYLMVAEKWDLNFDLWQKGVEEWMFDLMGLASQLKFKRPEDLIRISLTERVVGTILADITGSDRLETEKKKGLVLMKRLFERLI